MPFLRMTPAPGDEHSGLPSSSYQFATHRRTNPEVLLSVSDATATEGTDATMDFVVTLNRSWSRTITVDYTTIDVTAQAGSDYQAKTGTLTFDPGQTSKTISIPIIDDTVNDSGETFELILHDAKGADIDVGLGTGTILNTEVLTGSFWDTLISRVQRSGPVANERLRHMLIGWGGLARTSRDAQQEPHYWGCSRRFIPRTRRTGSWQ